MAELSKKSEHKEACNFLVTFWSTLSVQYWCDSTIFERRMVQLSSQNEANLLSFKLMAGFIEQVDTLVNSQLPENDELEEGLLTPDSIVIDNQQVYKMLMLVKNSTLLQIFYFMLVAFKSDSQEISIITCLTACLKLYDLKVSPGKNQMMLKVTPASSHACV